MMNQSTKSVCVAAATIAFFGSLTFVATRNARPHTLAAGTITPFQTTVTIKINNTKNIGAANSVLTGSQSFAVPAGQRLTIETVSAFRTDPPLASGNFDEISSYLQTTVNGTACTFTGPSVTRSDEPSLVSGSSGALKINADPGTNVLINGFRNSTSLTETMYVQVSGYLTTL